jgi:hypothetical protein
LIATDVTQHAAFLSDLELRFADATSAAGRQDRYFDLAGVPVRLRFAGPRLNDALTGPLAHLELGEDAEPALTVHLWDTESTSTPGPDIRWELDDYRELGVLRGFFGDGVYAIFQRDSRSLLVLDAERRRGFYWVQGIHELHMLDIGSPLRTLFNLWMWQSRADAQLLHSAAVARPDGAALIVGRAGAGKSSTSLACLDSDLLHLGDDYVLIRHGEPATVHSLYCSAKADRETMDRVPGLADMAAEAQPPETEKTLLDLHRHAPSKLLRSAPLAAVIVPRITGRAETTSRPCSAGAALAALAPSTMLQLPGRDEATLQGLRGIVDAVPSHVLELGTDPALIPPAIEGILDRR